MTTRYEGAGARDTTLTVAKAGEEIGDDVVPEGQIALCFNYDEVFYIQGRVEDVYRLMEKAKAAAMAASIDSLPMFDLSSIQPDHKVIEANQARLRGDQEPCAVCGKPVRDLFKYQVHLSNQGNLYPTTVDVDVANNLPQGTMYFFPVGPDCAKKVPKEYLHVENKVKS